MELVTDLIWLGGFLTFGVIWIVFRQRWKSKQLQKLAANRDSSFPSFFASLDSDTDETIAESVYEHLQILLAWGCLDFPVAKDDRLRKDYDMDQDDLVFLLEVVCEECPEAHSKAPIPKVQSLTVSSLLSYLTSHTIDSNQSSAHEQKYVFPNE